MASDPISTGKSQFQLLFIGVSVLGMLLLLFEGLNFRAPGLLAGQAFAAAIPPIMCGLVMTGHRMRWLLFMTLIIAGMFTFYIGGSRMMAYDDTGEVGLTSYMIVCGGLAYVLSAVYLGYSMELAAYIRDRADARKARRNPGKV